VQQKYVFRAVI